MERAIPSIAHSTGIMHSAFDDGRDLGEEEPHAARHRNILIVDRVGASDRWGEFF